MRDLSASLLRRLWPPVVAPKTRIWVSENVKAGRITEGTFKISLPVDAIATAQRERVLPDNAIDVRMTLAGVTTSYFKDMPAFQGAGGELVVKDRQFAVALKDVDIDLPSGATVRLDLGKMEVANMLATPQIASFTFQGGGGVPEVLEYLNLPALGLVSKSGLDPRKTGGRAQVSVALKLPLVKGVAKDKIALSARAKIADGSLTGAIPKIDVSDGDLDLTLFDGELELAGTAKLNGVPTGVTWHKGKGPAAQQSVVVEATFDDEGRRKLGADLGRLVKGPVTVRARIADLADKEGPMEIAADLSKAELNLPAVGWSRPPTANTKATFVYYRGGEKGRRIENLVVSGADLSIAGEVALTAEGGLRSASLKDVVLGEDNRFSAAIKTNETRLEYVGISGYQALWIGYIISATLCGLSGAIFAIAQGLVTPEMGYWVRSGEIVFVAILGGVGHPVGAFIGAGIFEFVKLFAAAYLTGAWQMVLGLVLIAMVFLAPRGISAMLENKVAAKREEA